MRGPYPDETRTRRVDAVRPRERQWQPGQRRSAPASRWARGMRAQCCFHRARHFGRDQCDGGGEGIRIAVGIPVEHQVRRFSTSRLDGLVPARLRDGGGCDEDALFCPSGGGRPRERHLLHERKSLVGRRRLELAERSHLGCRREQAGLTPDERSQLVGRGQRAEALELALDDVDLGLCERRVQPDAPRRDPVSRRRLDDVASRRASEIGVVEDDPASA
jgi:hypothetical protein